MAFHGSRGCTMLSDGFLIACPVAQELGCLAARVTLAASVPSLPGLPLSLSLPGLRQPPARPSRASLQNAFPPPFSDILLALGLQGGRETNQGKVGRSSGIEWGIVERRGIRERGIRGSDAGMGHTSTEGLNETEGARRGDALQDATQIGQSLRGESATTQCPRGQALCTAS